MLDQAEMPAEVSAVFEGFADSASLRHVREMVFSEAARLCLGQVSETLKWGQPSYLVEKGTPIRLGMLGGRPAMFVHCQTDIVENARELFGDGPEFSGNRALVLGGDARVEAHVISAALTYHQRA